MSMFNDIEWEARGNEELCENILKRVAEYARQILRGHWSFMVPGSEKKVVRNLRWHTKWMMDANSGENAAEL